MPQTFYIEADEEIISVIGRLRKSSAEENIFVFPKRALVMQSIVNLRLFQREAQKLGKKIIVVSQDEVGRMLAEKAGVETKNYSDDFSPKGAHLELTPVQSAAPVVAPLMANPQAKGMLRSESIGSADFHVAPVLPPESNVSSHVPVSNPSISRDTSSRDSLVQDPISLRVRNAAPQKLTALNSMRMPESGIVQPLRPSVAFPTASTPISAEPQVQSQAPIVSPHTPIAPQKNSAQTEYGERLKNFYNAGNQNSSAVPLPAQSGPQLSRAAQTTQATTPISGRKAHTIFLILGGISLLSFLGLLAFLFLPKAEIHVTPYKIGQNVDVELMGKQDAAPSDDQSIGIRIIERDKEVTLTVPTTGKSGGTNQKARGSVIITNNFSSDPQPLVATTRLETADGKLFRLVTGVTVPGMITKDGKKEPGVIEADVIADQSGEIYNIDPTTLHITGFKGTPKYDTFPVKLNKATIGGGNSGTSDVMVVAKIDLDTAEREAREKAKGEFLSDIRSELMPGERVLDEQIDITTLLPVTSPQIGTVASSFEYKNTVKVRAFIFSEKLVEERIEASSNKNVQGIKLRLISSTISYDDSSANFSEGTLRLRAHAEVMMESDIDREALQNALLGKPEEKIPEILGDFPEVKKIEVIFRPQWFVQSIPDSEKRVFIVVKQGEEGV